MSAIQGLFGRSRASNTTPLIRLLNTSSRHIHTPHNVSPTQYRPTPMQNGQDFSNRSIVQAAKEKNRQLSTTSTLFQGLVSFEKKETKYAQNEVVISKNNKRDNDDFWKLPLGAWDTHFHIFDPAYPYSPSRAFTPPAAPRNSFNAFNASLTSTGNASALVLVQPSVYGTDNSLALNFLRKEQKITTDRAVRAIVVLDLETMTDKELINMHALGVRGIRFNMAASGKEVQTSDLRERILAVANRLEGLEQLKNWFLQLNIPGKLWKGIENTVRDLPFRVIADHQGGMKGKSDLLPGSTTVTQPGYDSLMKLAKSGKVFIKISAGYRSSKLTEGGYDDLEELIKTFAKEVPDQLLWGSDWPHTGSSKDRPTRGIEVIEPLRKVDNKAALKNLRRWMGETAWLRMMVENPNRMFR